QRIEGAGAAQESVLIAEQLDRAGPRRKRAVVDPVAVQGMDQRRKWTGIERSPGADAQIAENRQSPAGKLGAATGENQIVVAQREQRLRDGTSVIDRSRRGGGSVKRAGGENEIAGDTEHRARAELQLRPVEGHIKQVGCTRKGGNTDKSG